MLSLFFFLIVESLVGKLKPSGIKERLQASGVCLYQQHISFTQYFVGGGHGLAFLTSNQRENHDIRLVSGPSEQAMQRGACVRGIRRDAQLSHILTNAEQLAVSRVFFPPRRKTPTNEGDEGNPSQRNRHAYRGKIKQPEAVALTVGGNDNIGRRANQCHGAAK